MEGACAVYYNCWSYIDYLIEIGKSIDSDCLLMENLFIILSTLEMIVLTQTCVIVHFAFVLPMQVHSWKTHELSKYEFMGHVYNFPLEMLPKHCCWQFKVPWQRLCNEYFWHLCKRTTFAFLSVEEINHWWKGYHPTSRLDLFWAVLSTIDWKSSNYRACQNSPRRNYQYIPMSFKIQEEQNHTIYQVLEGNGVGTRQMMKRRKQD